MSVVNLNGLLVCCTLGLLPSYYLCTNTGTIAWEQSQLASKNEEKEEVPMSGIEERKPMNVYVGKGP